MYSEMMGWTGETHPELIAEAFSIMPDEFKTFKLKDVGNRQFEGSVKRMMLWEIARKLLGADIPQFAQVIGDCVSFGSSHVVEFAQIFDIANGKLEEFKKSFPPYIYGISRVQIGGGRLWGDGSNGVWAAQGVQKYGFIALDTPNCPQYSGRVAKQWGGSGPPKEFIEIGNEHKARTIAQITNWKDALDSVMNGYPIILCSNVGYDMKPRSDGFMHNSTRWSHAMALIGVDEGDGSVPAHGCILNSWPKGSFGQIKDFRTGEIWPDNTIRATPQDIEKALKQGDSYSVSGLDGFNVQTLDQSFFHII